MEYSVSLLDESPIEIKNENLVACCAAHVCAKREVCFERSKIKERVKSILSLLPFLEI